MSKLNLGDSLILNSDITVGGGEVKTGATFNGKPVYCKVVQCQYASTSGQGKDTAHGIANIREIIKIDGTCDDTSSYWFSINFSTGTYSQVFADRTIIRAVTNYGNLLNRTFNCWLYYTKTTD